MIKNNNIYYQFPFCIVITNMTYITQNHNLCIRKFIGLSNSIIQFHHDQIYFVQIIAYFIIFYPVDLTHY